MIIRFVSLFFRPINWKKIIEIFYGNIWDLNISHYFLGIYLEYEIEYNSNLGHKKHEKLYEFLSV